MFITITNIHSYNNYKNGWGTHTGINRMAIKIRSECYKSDHNRLTLEGFFF